MKELENIKKIFWHELGHLCADIVRVKKVDKLRISEVKISWVKKYDWSGHVESLPEQVWSDIVKNNNKFTYSLLSLLSGCVFQTIYEQVFLGREETRFEDCFCIESNCLGNGDWMNYNQILSEFRITYPNSRGDFNLMNFLEKEVIEIYRIEVLKMKEFFNSLKGIVDIQAQIIFDDLKKKGSPDIYSYCFRNEQLEELIEKVKPHLDEYRFREVLEEVSEKIVREVRPFLQGA
jgi:hypothetical protein